jgi:DinB superfamily
MGTLDFFRPSLKTLHGNLMDAVKELTDEQLHFCPLGKGNPIAFMLWHTVRTEDSVVNFLLQKKPPVWNAEGWDKKFGMDSRAQGTGMSPEQSAALRISNLADFLKYSENVFKATEAYMETLKEAELDRVEEFQFLGKRSLGSVIVGIVLSHGAGHLGEIWYVKGLQGLKGSPI